jgi:subtilisin family serine protease
MLSTRGYTRLLLPFAVLSVLLVGATPAVSSNLAAPVATRLLVKFKPQVAASVRAGVLRSVGGTVESSIPQLGVDVLQAPSAAFNQLQANPGVDYVERDARVAPSDVALNDFRWRDSWALPRINAPQAWSVTTGDPRVVIAVLDTGVDYRQPDLQGAFVAGYDFVNNDTDPSDDNGHGTGAAGVVAARSDNGVGVTSICGGCSIMPIKIAGSDGYATWSAMASGITWAVDHGARILSISFASTSGSTTVSNAIQYARSHDALVFASAGNYSSATPYYPAAYPGAIAVAATDENDALASYSDYGSWVQVAAPGCNYSTLWTATNSNPYNLFCGTSSAAPAAAAVAGLALSYSPAASADQIEQALYAGATKVGSFVKYGRVDAWGTLASLGAGAPAASAAPAARPGDLPVLLTWPGNPLTSNPQAGQILAASSGGWVGSLPLAFTWTWRRCDTMGANCQLISSSTASTYTVSTADNGYTLQATLAASNNSGSASATSVASLPVGGGSASGGSTGGTAPVDTTLPTISGTPQVGQTMAATAGSWSGSPTGYAYQWQRCDTNGGSCTAISGTTASSYTLASADSGFTIRIAVTASNAYGSDTASSNATAVVASGGSTSTNSTTTASFAGTVSKGQPSRSYSITVGAGVATASLSFSKSSTLTLTVSTSGGSTVGTTSGASALSLAANLQPGTYIYTVSNATGNASFNLNISYVTP